MRKLQYLFMTLSALFMAVPAFAQATGAVSTGAVSPRSAPAWAWGSLPGCAESARAAPPLPPPRRWRAIPEPGPNSTLLVLGLAFIESLSLYTLVIIFVKIH